MEKIRNKAGKITSYREKVYVNGNAVSKSFKRKSDALKWKRSFAFEQQKKEALGIDHIQSIDFKSFFELWFEMKKNQGMAIKTLEHYQIICRKYLLPNLEKTQLEKINHALAQKVLNQCRKNKLGVRRTNDILVMFKQILNSAVELDYLIRNPLKKMKKIKAQPRSLTYWMPHEIEKFLSSNVDHPFYPLFVVALNTGMRRGELAGLCWDKVNLDERRIEIARIRDRYGLRDTTKTGVIRHIPLNASAWEVLKELSHNKRHPRLVFALENGEPIDAHHLSERHFKKAIGLAGVPKIRFHDLRTSYASNFVMAGGDIFALSKLLGHTSVEMTARKYAALHPSFMKNIVETVQFSAKGNVSSLSLVK